MALKSSFSGLHLLFRMLGLTGLITLLVGGISWTSFPSANEAVDLYVGDVRLLSVPSEFHQLILWVLAGGAAAVVLALLVEIRGVVGALGSRRVGLGSNVALQVLLASVLVGGVNWLSFNHYRRFDWTWDKSFTLPDDVRQQLAQLRGDTDIIIYEGGEAKRDKYDLAAEKKLVEKVQDLAELFQDLGPRFRVQILDIKDENFDAKVEALKNPKKLNKPELAAQIEKAPENSIFFHARGKVQRLAFHDVYQIDKQASAEANGGQGNLVLNYQGVRPIARKILNIEEKSPRLAMAVVHHYLTMSDREHLYFTMNGAKKVLEEHGFDCKDLLMRKVEEGVGLSPDPAVLTFEESRYEQIEEELALLNDAIAKMDKEHVEDAKFLRLWRDSSLAELNKTYAGVYLPNGQYFVITRAEVEKLKKSGRPFKLVDVDDEDKQIRTKAYERNLVILQNVLEMNRQERDTLQKEKKTLNADELAEKRRIADVEIKMKRELADRDILIVPRYTAMNIPRGELIPNRVHKLDTAQLKAIKHFIKEGKAVLFLLGPINEPEEEMPFREGGGVDELETMLTDLGFTLPKQTVIFNVEAKDYNERKVGVMFAGRETEIPSVKFDWPPDAVKRRRGEPARPHPIRTSLNMTSRALGKGQEMDLRVRHPRPVYVQRNQITAQGVGTIVASLSQANWAGASASASAWLNQRESSTDDGAVLFVTSEEAWNEDQPFIKKGAVPRFEPTKDDDPKKNTPEEERRGPFPIAVALEREAPSSWFDDAKPGPKARIAVVGHGGVFTGQALTPIKEKLLLDVVNWLTGRDDLLARQSETPWQYPRVHLEAWQTSLWQWGARLGLPLLFVYMGLMMWLVRRMR